MNSVSVQVKRLGGGFGGKSTRNHAMLGNHSYPPNAQDYQFISVACLAAWKLQKPVKFTLDRKTDQIMTGTSAPHLIQYKVTPRHISSCMEIKCPYLGWSHEGWQDSSCQSHR